MQQVTEPVYVVYYLESEGNVMHFFAGNLSPDDEPVIQLYVDAASGEGRRVEVLSETEFVSRGGRVLNFGPH